MEYQQYATLHYFAARRSHSVAYVREDDIMRAAVANLSARLDRAAWKAFVARIRGLAHRLTGHAEKHAEAVAHA